MKLVAWLFYTALAGLSVAVNFGMGAIIMASIPVNRWLAYPTYFGTCMMLSGMVFLVFLPVRWRPFVAVSIIDRMMAGNDQRFRRGPWPWIRRRGPFALTLATALALGPLVAALVMRILGLNEQKAWWYAFVTNLITTGILVSVYLGLFSLIKNLVAHAFA
jgi:hypothetical protein